MNGPVISPVLLVALAAGVTVIALAACFIVMQRLSLDRRARFARFLGKAFVVLIAGSVMLGMIVQFIR